MLRVRLKELAFTALYVLGVCYHGLYGAVDTRLFPIAAIGLYGIVFRE